MKTHKLIKVLSIFAIAASSSAAFATAYPNISMNEYADMLEWECAIDDSTYYKESVDYENKEIIYESSFEGKTICLESLSSEVFVESKCSGDFIFETNDGNIYKKGMMIENIGSDSIYQICRINASMFAYDSSTRTGHIDRESGEE